MVSSGFNLCLEFYLRNSSKPTESKRLLITKRRTRTKTLLWRIYCHCRTKLSIGFQASKIMIIMWFKLLHYSNRGGVYFFELIFDKIIVQTAEKNRNHNLHKYQHWTQYCYFYLKFNVVATKFHPSVYVSLRPPKLQKLTRSSHFFHRKTRSPARVNSPIFPIDKSNCNYSLRFNMKPKQGKHVLNVYRSKLIKQSVKR